MGPGWDGLRINAHMLLQTCTAAPARMAGAFCCLWDKIYQIGIMHSGGMNVRAWRTIGREELGKDILRDLKCILYRLFNGGGYR